MKEIKDRQEILIQKMNIILNNSRIILNIQTQWWFFKNRTQMLTIITILFQLRAPNNIWAA